MIVGQMLGRTITVLRAMKRVFEGGGKGGNNSELLTKLWDRTESSFCQGAEQNTARVVCSGTSCRETVITLFRLKGKSKTTQACCSLIFIMTPIISQPSKFLRKQIDIEMCLVMEIF